MSIIDKRLEFSDAQAVTTSAISANVYDRKDLGLNPNATENIGAPAQMYLVVQTAVNCTDSGSDATLEVTFESAENAALSTNPVVHFSTGELAFAGFKDAGTVLAVVPLPAAQYKERYTVDDGPLTGGAFNAFLTLDPHLWTKYADGKPIAPTS
jgi:hypothetical protein